MASSEEPTGTPVAPLHDVAFTVFWAKELQGFGKHIEDAALKYSVTGEIPKSIFKGMWIRQTSIVHPAAPTSIFPGLSNAESLSGRKRSNNKRRPTGSFVKSAHNITVLLSCEGSLDHVAFTTPCNAAYNMFVKAKLEELKADPVNGGVKHTDLLQTAGKLPVSPEDEWSSTERAICTQTYPYFDALLSISFRVAHTVRRAEEVIHPKARGGV